MNTFLVSYIGPETTLPLMSVLASFVGVFLMFGRTLTQYAKRCVKADFRPKTAKPDPDRWRRSL